MNARASTAGPGSSFYPPRCARRFVPERVIAHGGFGEVWQARQVGLERLVAVKLLRAGSAGEPDHVLRLLAEARITASLSHPHIVRIIDHDMEAGVPWIAYELLAGHDLRAALERETRLPWPEVVTAAMQVASALEEIHGAGIIHRDIKPENIFRVREDHFKLTDFGAAKWIGNSFLETDSGLVVGTVAYIAPESFRGEPPSPASDLYSLGVTLFELLTGRLPFPRGPIADMVRGHLREPPPDAGEHCPGLPKRLDQLVARLLAKDPAARFPSAAALYAELAAVKPRPSDVRRHLTLPSAGTRARFNPESRPVSSRRDLRPQHAGGWRGLLARVWRRSRQALANFALAVAGRLRVHGG